MTIPIHVSVAICEENRVLMVQEADPRCYGRWNLPGGHLERGETLQEAARREVLEETGLTVELSALVGVYTDPRLPAIHTLRFAFIAPNPGQAPAPGADILSLRWLEPAEILAFHDRQMINPRLLRRIVGDLARGVRWPLDVLVEPTPRIL